MKNALLTCRLSSSISCRFLPTLFDGKLANPVYLGLFILDAVKVDCHLIENAQ